MQIFVRPIPGFVILKFGSNTHAGYELSRESKLFLQKRATPSCKYMTATIP